MLSDWYKVQIKDLSISLRTKSRTNSRWKSVFELEHEVDHKLSIRKKKKADLQHKFSVREKTRKLSRQQARDYIYQHNINVTEDFYLESKDEEPSVYETDFSEFKKPSRIESFMSNIGTLEEFKAYLAKDSNTLYYLDHFISFVTVVWQCVRHPNPVDIALAVSQWISTYDSGDHAKYTVPCRALGLALAGIVSAIQVKTPSGIQLEAGEISDYLSSFTNFLSLSIGSSFIAAIRDAFLAICTLKIFDKSVATEIYAWLGPPPAKMNFLQVFMTCLRSLTKVVRATELMASGCTFAQVLISEDPIAAAIAAASELLLNEKLTYSGIPIKGYVDVESWIGEGLLLISSMTKLKAKMHTKHASYLVFCEKLATLTVAVTAKETTARTTTRVPPLAFVVHGKPNTGKSSVLDFLYRTFSEIKGIKYRDGMVYSRVTSSDYWEMYSPSTMPYIHYSELGSIHENIVKMQGDKVISELTSLVDSRPFAVDMADVALKGKIMACPSLLTADTNNEELHLKHIVHAPAAYLRRFIFVQAHVKPEFCAPGTTNLDSSRVPEDHPVMDLWYFDVKTHEAINNKDTNVVWHLKATDKDDIYKFGSWLRMYATSHMKRYTLVNTRLANQDINIYQEDKRPEVVPFMPEEIKDIAEERHEFNLETLTTEIAVALDKSVCSSILGKQATYPEFREWNRHHCNLIEACPSCEEGKLCVHHVANIFNFSITDISDAKSLFCYKRDNLYDVLILKVIANNMAGLREEIDATRDTCGKCLRHMRGMHHVCGSDHIPPWETPQDVREEIQLRELIEDAKLEEEIKEQKLAPEAPEVVFRKRALDMFRNGEEVKVPHLEQMRKEAGLFMPNKKRENYLEKMKGFALYGKAYVHAKCHEQTHNWTVTKGDMSGAFTSGSSLLLSLFTDVHLKNWDLLSLCRENELLAITVVVIGLMAFFTGNLIYFVLGCYLLDQWVRQHSVTINRKDDLLKFRHHWSRLKSTKESSATLRLTMATGQVLLAATALCTALAMISKFMKKDKTIKAEGSAFSMPSEANEPLNAIEDGISAGKSYVRIPTKFNSTWNQVHSLNLTSHRGEMEELVKIGESSSRFVNVQVIEKGVVVREMNQYLFGVRGNKAVINSHSLWPPNLDYKITMYNDDTKSKVVKGSHVTERDISRSKLSDWCTVSLSGVQFRDITTHFPEDKVLPKEFAMSIGSELTRGKFYDELLSVSCNPKFFPGGELRVNNYVRYRWPNHAPGKCGLPVVVNKGAGNCFIGIHFGGSVQGEDGTCVVITRQELLEVLSNDDSPLMEISSFPSGTTIECGMPVHKSVFNHIPIHSVRYYGKVNGPVIVNQRSRLTKSILAPVLPFVFGELNHVCKQVYVPPVMKPIMKNGKYINPVNVFCESINKSHHGLDRVLLRQIADEMKDEVVGKLREAGVPSISPLDVETAINGADQDIYIRRVNASTAAGFGLSGKKKDHLPIVDDEKREPTSDVKAEVLRILEHYQKGESSFVVYKAALKDEPRAQAKVDAGATRMFFVSPLPFLIVQRMFLAPIFSLMIEHREAFGTAIGIDMHREADALYKQLTNFSKRIIEQDYKGYDTSMDPDFRWAGITYLIMLAKELGYTEEALLMMKAFLTDCTFPQICLLLDLFGACIQPSGFYGTAEFNSIIGRIIMRYMFYKLQKEMPEGLVPSAHVPGKADYATYVLDQVYGDDLLAAVKEAVASWFNNITYQRACLQYAGMITTPATKGAEMSEFVLSSEMSFLKRRFVFHPSFQRVVAPLDKDSLYKMLEWTMPSAYVTKEEQLVQTLASFSRELAFHVQGPIHDKVMAMLKKEFHEVFPDTLWDVPSFEYLVSDLADPVMLECDDGWHVCLRDESSFDALCRALLVEEDMNCQELCQRPSIDAIERLQTESRVDDSMDASIGSPITQDSMRVQPHSLEDLDDPLSDLLPSNYTQVLRIFLDELILEEKELRDESSTFSSVLEDVAYHKILRSSLYQQDDKIRLEIDKRLAYEARISALAITMKIVKGRINEQFQIESEDISVMAAGAITSSKVDEHDNVTDVGGEESDEKYAGTAMAPTMYTAFDLGLGGYLSHPIQIAQFNDTVGGTLNFRTDLWKTVFADPTLRSKLRNYAFIRCDLVVRIVTSGTPFHYNCYQVAYIPMAARQSFTAAYSALSGASAARINFLKYLSQTKFTKLIDPKQNKPLEMHIPFIYPNPFIKLYNSAATVITSATDLTDTVGMGTLFINNLNSLGCVTASPSPVSFQIYANLTNITLGGPSATKLEIATESDERITGPVQKFASGAASVSKALTTIPWLTPFAKASEIGFGALSKMAAIFGWSKPVIQTMPMRMRPEPYQNAAQTIGYDTGHRITLDPKQELTVHPGYVSQDIDEMHVNYLTSRESLLDQFTWTNTAASFVPIWRCLVTPRAGKIYTGTGAIVQNQPTALAFAATPFSFWRGTQKYRLDFIVSALHRGKYAIIYEPNVCQDLLIEANFDFNKQFMKIVDLQETQSVEFCVEWNSAREWAYNIGTTAINGTVGVSTTFNAYKNFANGYIYVVPITRLQSPDNSSISVNCYVSSDDMQFNYVNSDALPRSRIIVESSESVPVTCMVLNPSGESKSHISEDYFGEQINNFRALLKRFWTSRISTSSGEAGTGLKYVFEISTIFPPVTPNTTDIVPATLVPNLFGYLGPAFLAMRGSVKKRCRTHGLKTQATSAHTVVALQPLTATGGTAAISYSLDPLSAQFKLNGTTQFVPSMNPGIEIELPFYSPNLFCLSSTTDPFFNNGTNDAYPTLQVRNYIVVTETDGVTGALTYSEDSAIGEDFSFAYWVASPPFQVA